MLVVEFRRDALDIDDLNATYTPISYIIDYYYYLSGEHFMAYINIDSKF